ncbi:MAG: cellulase family glycosylhydrolase, partial [Endomicrobiia bacterium]
MKIKINLLFLAVISNLISFSFSQTPVQVHGQLRVSGRYLVDRNGVPVVLRGMSLFWSQWGSKYWNSSVIDWVATDWKVNVIRAAMGIEDGGYLTYPTTHKNLVKTVVQACIDRGIYVIIDWHDHNAPAHQSQAIEFFREMAQTYGNTPNVIYEIFNEPDLDDNWNGIKSYAQAVIQAIRQYDPDNVILVGTPNWCQYVDVAAGSPLTGVSNVMYVLHFYAATHGSNYRHKAQTAINAGLPLFVSEFGTCEYTGNGRYDFNETDAWINFLEQYKISWVNWSLNDKPESCSALVPGASASGGWLESQLTQSGRYIRNKIRSYNQSTGGIVAYLTTCSSGSIVWASTNVSVYVSAGNSISKVEFYVDGTLKYTDNSSPYSWVWDTTQYSDGWHNLKVVAYDTQNNTSQVQTSVVVYNSTLPSINITNPQNGSIIYGNSAMVYVEANKGYEVT